MQGHLPAGIYCRISQISAEERKQLAEEGSLGVQRQEADGRELCQRRGWEVGEVYVDDDTSAYKRRKPRLGYRQMLDDIHSGRIRTVVSWHMDRLHRDPRELEEFIEVVERAGAGVETVKTGKIDLATPSGRLVARLLGASARYESEHKADRVARKHLELALAGQPAGGGRPFGYQADKVTVDETEAAAIREAARRILGGDSLRAICRDLNERSILTPAGRPWGPTSLKRVLISARISGRREFQREKSKSRIGQIKATTAKWPAIITVLESDRLRALLTEDGRRKGVQARAYLLAGLVVCGRPDCGQILHGEPRPSGRRMVCNGSNANPGCYRIVIAAEPLEALITEAVLRHIERNGGLSTHMPSDDGAHLAAELQAIDNQLRAWGRAAGQGRLLPASWEGLQEGLAYRRAGIERELAKIHRSYDLEGLPDPLRPEWPSLTMARKCAVLKRFVERVVVQPAKRRGGPFDEDRVSILWRA